jgi:hypothetical protein
MLAGATLRRQWRWATTKSQTLLETPGCENDGLELQLHCDAADACDQLFKRIRTLSDIEYSKYVRILTDYGFNEWPLCMKELMFLRRLSKLGLDDSNRPADVQRVLDIVRPVALPDADCTFDPLRPMMCTIGLASKELLCKFQEFTFKKFLVPQILLGESSFTTVHLVASLCAQLFDDVDFVELDTESSFLIEECTSLWSVVRAVLEKDVTKLNTSKAVRDDATKLYHMLGKRVPGGGWMGSIALAISKSDGYKDELLKFINVESHLAEHVPKLVQYNTEINNVDVAEAGAAKTLEDMCSSLVVITAAVGDAYVDPCRTMLKAKLLELWCACEGAYLGQPLLDAERLEGVQRALSHGTIYFPFDADLHDAVLTAGDLMAKVRATNTGATFADCCQAVVEAVSTEKFNVDVLAGLRSSIESLGGLPPSPLHVTSAGNAVRILLKLFTNTRGHLLAGSGLEVVALLLEKAPDPSALMHTRLLQKVANLSVQMQGVLAFGSLEDVLKLLGSSSPLDNALRDLQTGLKQVEDAEKDLDYSQYDGLMDAVQPKIVDVRQLVQAIANRTVQVASAELDDAIKALTSSMAMSVTEKPWYEDVSELPSLKNVLDAASGSIMKVRPRQLVSTIGLCVEALL